MFGAQGLVSRNTQTNGLSSAGTLWYAFDERGSVAQRTGSSGGVVSSDLYDAFGNVTSTGGPDVFGFGGQAGYDTDAETGLILCTNRFYDPQQGRFLTRDPMGYGGGINLYSYTQNNPVNWMDPSGLSFQSAVNTVWASFPTLLGAIGSIGGDYYHDNTNNVTVVRGGWAAYLLNKGGWGAMTLGEVIITPDPSNLPAIYNHELGHVDQARVLGPLFPILYPVGTLIGAVRGDYHDANPFEVDADARAGRYNKYNDDARPWGWGGADPTQPKHIGPTSCPF